MAATLLLVCLGLWRGAARGGDTLPGPEAVSQAEAGSIAGERSFGSEAVLGACWSPDELMGRAREAPPSARRPSPPSAEPLTQLAPLPQAFVGSIRSVRLRGSGKAIALTFDLCETEGRPAGYEGAIADYLRRERVKATFFAGGRWIQSHPERAMQLMADPLFELGNHGWAHRNARRLSEQDLSQEVLRPQSEYELLREELASRLCTRAVHPRELAKIPKTPLAFRFPYGACTEEALAFVARAGLPAIQWDVVTGDASAEQTAGGVAREVFRAARPGSILVAHANGRGHGTAEALPLFVPELRRRGFEFVTVTELLGAGEPVVAQSCYILKPGDTVRYDRLKRKP